MIVERIKIARAYRQAMETRDSGRTAQAAEPVQGYGELRCLEALRSDDPPRQFTCSRLTAASRHTFL